MYPLPIPYIRMSERQVRAVNQIESPWTVHLNNLRHPLYLIKLPTLPKYVTYFELPTSLSALKTHTLTYCRQCLAHPWFDLPRSSLPKQHSKHQ